MSELRVWECPNCGGTEFVDVGQDKRRCDYCGSLLARPETKPGMVTCRRCGLGNVPGIRYCAHCGLALSKWTSFEKRKTDLAIISIFATVAGSLFVPVGGAILGLILAYKARGEARASGGMTGSEDLARIAIMLGWLGLVVSVLPICFFPVIIGGQLGVSICSGTIELSTVFLGG